ncbi:MAG: gamma-glutamyl-gamma-aminobutyrate hydrolase family protein [Thermoanaerobaculia bacterium]
MRRSIAMVCEDREHAEPYLAALAAGGLDGLQADVITPQEAEGAGRRVVEAAGVVLCGGPDVEPQRYGEEPLHDAGLKLLPELDRVEWEALEAARGERVPVWAICRGLQVLNVFLGGSLWQDLGVQVPGALRHDLKGPRDALSHTVHAAAVGHPLADRLRRDGETKPQVNTRHHQALRRVAPELTVLATAADGVVEAAAGADVDPRDGWWLRGVQWHPENLVALELQRLLFADFLAAAELFAAGR